MCRATGGPAGVVSQGGTGGSVHHHTRRRYHHLQRDAENPAVRERTNLEQDQRCRHGRGSHAGYRPSGSERAGAGEDACGEGGARGGAGLAEWQA